MRHTWYIGHAFLYFTLETNEIKCSISGESHSVFHRSHRDEYFPRKCTNPILNVCELSLSFHIIFNWLYILLYLIMPHLKTMAWTVMMIRVILLFKNSLFFLFRIAGTRLRIRHPVMPAILLFSWIGLWWVYIPLANNLFVTDQQLLFSFCQTLIDYRMSNVNIYHVCYMVLSWANTVTVSVLNDVCFINRSRSFIKNNEFYLFIL